MAAAGWWATALPAFTRGSHLAECRGALRSVGTMVNFLQFFPFLDYGLTGLHFFHFSPWGASEGSVQLGP